MPDPGIGKSVEGFTPWDGHRPVSACEAAWTIATMPARTASDR
jgi:hypothetical protein